MMDRHSAALMRRALELDRPLLVQAGDSDAPLPGFVQEPAKNLLVTALHAQIGDDWLLGVQQSPVDQAWSLGQQRLFRAIAERVQSALSDIQMLDQIKTSQRRLLEAESIAQLGEWELDIATGQTRWSEQVHRIFGTQESQEIGPEFLSRIVHPDDWPNLSKSLQAAIETGKAYEIEYRIKRIDSEERWVYCKARRDLDDEGRPLKLTGIAQDITARKLAEEALITSQANLAEAQRIAGLGSWRLDLVSHRAFWSDQQYRCLGYAPGACEANLANFEAAVHPEDLDRVRRSLQKALQQRQSGFELDHRVVWRDGSEHVLQERALVEYAADGAPLAIIGTSQDITLRVAMAQELQAHRQHLEELIEQRTATIKQQAQIIDQIHDSVVTTDLDGLITSWNGGAERLFKIPAATALGRHISFIYPESEHEFLQQAIISPLKQRGLHETEVKMRRADGVEFPVHLSLSLLYDDQGQPRGMVGYSIDISEQKQRERQLARLAENLQAANKELESFSYSVSHDLRAPLRAIDGFSLALMEDYGERLDDIALDYLQRVRAGAQRMGLLIDDLLQLSRVSRETFKMEQVDLGEIADLVMQELMAADPERRIEFDRDDDMQVWGDARLLKIMLDNLLGNAWKFTSLEDQPRISFRRHPDDPQIFTIQDNGVGFDMRYADKLFGAFQRLHRTTDFPGTGVGLATVQRIVQRHGGRVWAEAKTNEGARFYVSFDARKGDSEDNR
jgi:PAS domain S-box-containing protein